MERRQFLKSLAATASMPLMPVGALKGAQISPSLYARAMTCASGGAYFSADYLKSKLGLDESLGKIVVARLKQDGLVGDMGRSGLMFSKTYYTKHIKILANAASAAGPAKAKSDVLEKVKNGVTPDETVKQTVDGSEKHDVVVQTAETLSDDAAQECASDDLCDNEESNLLAGPSDPPKVAKRKIGN